MLSIETRSLDRIFAALSNKQRRQIIYSLGLQPVSIGGLAKQQRLSLPAIHRHIKVLERAKLIRRKKNGRTNFLTLNRSRLILMQDWISQYHAYWGTDKETLENYIEGIARNEVTHKK